ncbi:hypothetical protein HID58_095193 [Brassica napus]|uniref:Transcription factor CBF/NF-Y/archaeal histone domain-containing protein n=1 Tax=Brassica napus TaxID=3708 RepID=A0ABQ7X4J1_BRANA|nr:hypothetical protein HID58_095193 [Brassica napus]
MRKKLDTRFPAARIKKIMQADEDVGKIALAVPVLVSKSLELFLQDLCDRTYEITLERGAQDRQLFAPNFIPHICVFKVHFALFLHTVFGDATTASTFIELVLLFTENTVERYNVFDFLREVVSKVPDYGQAQGQAHGTGDVTMDDRTISKRRLDLLAPKPISDEVNDSDEENKKSKTVSSCSSYKRWGMLSPVAGVVEGEDEEEVAVDELLKQPKEKI